MKMFGIFHSYPKSYRPWSILLCVLAAICYKSRIQKTHVKRDIGTGSHYLQEMEVAGSDSLFRCFVRPETVKLKWTKTEGMSICC